MLTGKQKRHLRAIGHNLKPVILIGKGEISEANLKEIDASLTVHELIKIKLLESCVMDKHDAADALAKECCADVAQILGKTILLYRPAKEPIIVLPTSGKK